MNNNKHYYLRRLNVGKGRLEAFSDGVIAIIITVMLLELKVPEGSGIESILSFFPKLSIYLLSFLFLGIYWMNHHHMLHATKKINGKALWANLSLLFWLSLFPLVANWMGENLFKSIPSVAYGFILFMAGLSYLIMQMTIINADKENDVLKNAIGTDWKGKLTQVVIISGILISFIATQIALGLYVVVILIWIIPDKRIEKALLENEK
jgi:uncharacterized membrane protein